MRHDESAPSLLGFAILSCAEKPCQNIIKILVETGAETNDTIKVNDQTYSLLDYAQKLAQDERKDDNKAKLNEICALLHVPHLKKCTLC